MSLDQQTPSTTPQPDLSVPSTLVTLRDVFRVFIALHAQKQAVYGASWRKHGELFSIFPNISRKYDRLERLLNTDGAPDGSYATRDETLFDTVADLGCYALLYTGWLNGLADSADEGFPAMAMLAEHAVPSKLRAMGLRVPETQADCLFHWSRCYVELETLLGARLDSNDPSIRLWLALRIAYAAAQWIVREARFSPAAYADWTLLWEHHDADA